MSTSTTTSRTKDITTTTPPKILFFDVFGTVLSWRSTLTRGLHELAQAKVSSVRGQTSIPADTRAYVEEHYPSAAAWDPFVQAWHDDYISFAHDFDPARDEWVEVSTLNARSLRRLLAEPPSQTGGSGNLEGLFDDDDVTELTALWGRLDSYPDSARSIAALNRKFATSTLSNGEVALLGAQARHAGLPWTHITSSQHFASYKPNPKVYLGAAEKLGAKPEECALVAAHLGDLKAAKQCGFWAVYVEREKEEAWGAEQVRQAREEGWVDMWITQEEQGFVTVAERFGISTASVDPNQS